MECKEAREFLGSLIDNELLGNILEEVKKHVDACKNCSRMRHSLLRLKNMLSRKITSYSAPTGLREQVLAGIGAGGKREFFFRTSD